MKKHNYSASIVSGTATVSILAFIRLFYVAGVWYDVDIPALAIWEISAFWMLMTIVYWEETNKTWNRRRAKKIETTLWCEVIDKYRFGDTRIFCTDDDRHYVVTRINGEIHKFNNEELWYSVEVGDIFVVAVEKYIAPDGSLFDLEIIGPELNQIDVSV